MIPALRPGRAGASAPRRSGQMRALAQHGRETTTMDLTKYDAAKQAVAACLSIDECKDWKDKAAALAAYARLARDEELENNARRIRARATRRIGELLLGIEDNKRGRHNSIRTGGGMN